MKNTVALLGVVAALFVGSSASAATIDASVVGEADFLKGSGTLSNSGETAETQLIASLLGWNTEEVVYTKVDVGGSAWTEVSGDPATQNLWAFDFGPYISNPEYFLVKLGNTTYTHYLYENRGNLQYGVIDLNLVLASKGTVTILSVSHAATQGGTPVPEPASMSLLLLGLAGLGIAGRRHRTRRQ